jgi:hypothetical protein
VQASKDDDRSRTFGGTILERSVSGCSSGRDDRGSDRDEPADGAGGERDEDQLVGRLEAT